MGMEVCAWDVRGLRVKWKNEMNEICVSFKR